MISKQNTKQRCHSSSATTSVGGSRENLRAVPKQIHNNVVVPRNYFVNKLKQVKLFTWRMVKFFQHLKCFEVYRREIPQPYQLASRLTYRVYKCILINVVGLSNVACKSRVTSERKTLRSVLRKGQNIIFNCLQMSAFI